MTARHHRPHGRLLGAVAALTLTLWALNAPVLAAHARFVVATPAPGSVVATLPPSMTITFSQPLANGTVINVRGPGGASAVGGEVTWQEATATVPLRTAGEGVYRVSYKTISATDGEAQEGAFEFGVGSVGAVRPSSTVAEGEHHDDGTPWPRYAGIVVVALVIAGGSFFWWRRRAP